MTLAELLELCRRHLAVIIALPVVFAIACAAYCYLLLPDNYTASTSMYILTTSNSQSSTSTDDSVSNSDLSASQQITNDVANLIKSSKVKNDAISQLGITATEFSKATLSVNSETNTRLLTLSVTSTDPEFSADVANAVAGCTDAVAKEVMGIEAVNIMDEASIPDKPSGPHRLTYVAVAFLAGLFLALAIIVLKDMLDTRVRKPEELEELLELPLIGRIPEIH